MTRDFLAYWKPETASNNISCGDGLLAHSASNQYGRLVVGDTVWIVTVRDGDLYLLGRILVAQLMDREEAARVLRSQNLWDAKYHICCKHGTAQALKEIFVSHLAADLRFETRNGNNHLDLKKGKVNPQQLQTMRLLDPSVVGLLKDALGNQSDLKKPNKVIRKETPKPTEPSRKAKSMNANPGNVLTALKRIQTAAKKHSAELVLARYRHDDTDDPLNGLCYVLSECMHHLFPALLKPYCISWGGGGTHWFLRYPDGQVLDAIAENGQECCEPEDYGSARRVPFRTKRPSKRAVRLYAWAGYTDPTENN
jgi:hypothetical protein